MPKNLPKVNWEVVSTTNETNGDVPVITKRLLGHVDNSSYPSIKVDIQLSVSTPANATGPVPVIMEFGFLFPAGAQRPLQQHLHRVHQQLHQAGNNNYLPKDGAMQ
jgi:hypothetical protein